MENNMQAAIQGMRDKGFMVVELATAQDVREYLLAHIAAGTSVGAGGSVSVQETGVLEALKERGCPVYSHWGVPMEQRPPIFENARQAQVYLSSVNAITKDGRLMFIDGTGNRVSALAYGSGEYYFVVSKNKLVDGGYSAALARIKKEACPPNARRLGLQTPCAETCICREKECQDSMCRMTLLLDRVPRNRSMTVLLVEEKLGY